MQNEGDGKYCTGKESVRMHTSETIQYEYERAKTQAAGVRAEACPASCVSSLARRSASMQHRTSRQFTSIIEYPVSHDDGSIDRESQLLTSAN